MKIFKISILLILLPVFNNCATSIDPKPTSPGNGSPFQTKKLKTHKFATPAMVRQFSREISGAYHVGPGDVLSLRVWKRPEISDLRIMVGANGEINVVRIGFIKVANHTINDIQKEITTRLHEFYENPKVTVRVEEQKNNRAFVLGRVANPGEIILPDNATLLQVLALAGGLPILDERKSPLTECVITRGEKSIRIDLKELLGKGNMELNARIQNNDTIFIPESGESEQIYLLGEISQPGIVRLTSGMTFLDALMMAGGPLRSADLEKTFVIRMGGEKGAIKEINLKTMFESADVGRNFLLQNSDVIFVARSGLSRFREFFDYVTAIMSGVDLSMSIVEKAGLMQELRRTWWGQQGFVNSN